jgi:hypothetical protein
MKLLAMLIRDYTLSYQIFMNRLIARNFFAKNLDVLRNWAAIQNLIIFFVQNLSKITTFNALDVSLNFLYGQAEK